MPENFVNRYQTALAATVTSGATTGTVTSVTGVPAVPFRGIISSEGANTDEIVLVTGRTGSTLTWTRAAEAVAGVQAASAHAIGATFTAIVTAASMAAAFGDPSAFLMALADVYAAPVMTTPPTVAIGVADAATTIPTPQTIAKENAALQYFGSPAGVGTVFPNTLTYSPDNIGAGGTGQIYCVSPWYIRFVHTGSVFDFSLKGSGGTYRILVNGEAVQAASTTLPNTGSFYRIKVTFAGSATRTITLELSGIAAFYEANIAAAPAAIAAPPAITGKMVFLGDSYMDGTGADAQTTAFPFIAARFLGWGNPLAMGLGGTGYLATGSYVKLGDHLTKDCLNLAPSIVVVAAGINDSAFTAAQVGTEAALVYAAIRAGLPNAKLIVVSPWFPRTPTPQYIIDLNAVLRDKAGAVGATYIDVTTRPWIFGTGWAGNYKLDGNSDRYITSDSTHPNQRGHNYLGVRLADAIGA